MSQPMYVASCCASGPGSTMQKFSACRKRFSEIQRFRSTSSSCMSAIWPAGPPKLMKPSRSQYKNAVEKGTCATSSFIEVDLLFSLPELLLVFFQFHVAADTV
ncbi:hypothetical protein QF025_005623 [Paraburkholderia graminis]|uniref:Uncharacterized protein n=1 Tax=Paraburkholderia graminis TaxID=60548 RepID=A0ABD5CNK9_9BURK|nr:hypothetical protein [Paraburkholderia graminis]